MNIDYQRPVLLDTPAMVAAANDALRNSPQILFYPVGFRWRLGDHCPFQIPKEEKRMSAVPSD